jgi:ElaB/YqjD/DUF883 family membrane-anchored ribosome-binding protein
MPRAEKRAKSARSHAAAGLQDLIDTADELLEDLQDQQGAAVEALRAKVGQTVGTARRKLEGLAPEIKEAASETIDSAVGFVRRDPWRAVALGALTLLAFSLLTRLGGDGD